MRESLLIGDQAHHVQLHCVYVPFARLRRRQLKGVQAIHGEWKYAISLRHGNYRLCRRTNVTAWYPSYLPEGREVMRLSDF